MSVRTLLATVLLFCATLSHAHKQSDSHLTLELTANDHVLHGQWDIALRDLDYVVGLDANADDVITWGELRKQLHAIESYALPRLHLTSIDGPKRSHCRTAVNEALVDHHVDGAYVVLRFVAACAVRPSQLEVNYRLLFDADPNHRGLLNLRSDGFDQSVVLSMESSSVALNVSAQNSPQQLRSFVTEGVWHIWHGYDHILFLFTLVLPAVVTYRAGAWEAQTSLRASSLDIIKVVTSFTAAHSLTLSLAALDVVHLPSRVVETAIAFTVLLGALNILCPIVRERRWIVALLFGLVHGLGFASVLADLNLTARGVLLSLAGFNVGVELGQLAIVAVLAPAIYLLRESVLYRRMLLPSGAAAISALAIYWIGVRWTA